MEDETRPTDAVPEDERTSASPERDREQLFKFDERRADPALSPRSTTPSESRPMSQPASVDEPTKAMPAPSWSPPRPTSAPVTPPAPRVEPSFGSPAPSVGPRTESSPPTQPAAATAQRRAQPQDRAGVQVRRLRRGRIAIRKVDPWAVMKFSLVFYFCMLVVVMLVVGILFTALKAFGVIDNIQKLLRDLDFYVTITGGVIFRWVFLLGLAGTVVASFVTMFMAFLYNLIADVVGGVELVVTERE